jgi:hypothetical protein
MQYSTLGPTGVQVSTLVLGALDAIVAPGVDLAAHEKNDTPPALLDAAQRRR